MRAILRVIGVVIAVVAILWLVYVSRSVLIWIAVAAFFAVAIDPLVARLQRWLPLRRAAAIALVYLMSVIVLAGVALIFVPPLVAAGQELTDTVPGYVEQVQESDLVRQLDEDYDITQRLEDRVTEALGGVAGPETAVDLAQHVVNGLVALISIAVITFLLSLYGPQLRAWLREQAAVRQRPRLDRVADRMYRVIAGYVVGVFAVAALGGIAAYIFLTIAGVPFAPLLAAWVSLMSLVPLVGATLGGIPYIIVAFFQGWPLGVAAIVFLVVYQQFENNVVLPSIHRRTVQLNPLWIIVAVLVGAQVLGVVGVLVAIPVAGIAQVLIQEWWAARGGGGSAASGPPPAPPPEPKGAPAEAEGAAGP